MGKAIYLSPSKQENNIGVGDYGTEEHRCNLIADIMEAELKRNGVTVYRNDPDMSLAEIVADSNKYDINLHFALHSNAYLGKSRGCEVFCWEKGTGAEGEKLANEIYLLLSAITPTSDRGVKQAKNYYGTGKHIYEIANTKAIAALAEIGFHDNSEDAAWIINNMELIAITIVKGILNYLGITYKEATNDKANDGYVYRVIAGAYSYRSNAELQVKALKNCGVESYIKLEKTT